MWLIGYLCFCLVRFFIIYEFEDKKNLMDVKKRVIWIFYFMIYDLKMESSCI